MEYENLGDDDFRLLMELENKEVTKSPEKNPWDYDSWDGYVGYEGYEGDDHHIENALSRHCQTQKCSDIHALLCPSFAGSHHLANTTSC